MEATLTEVINLGNLVQKVYFLDTPFVDDISPVENILLEYNLDQKLVKIINFDSDLLLHTFDLSLFDEDYPDVSLDGKILKDFLDLTSLRIYKETDDYCDIV